MNNHPRHGHHPHNPNDPRSGGAFKPSNDAKTTAPAQVTQPSPSALQVNAGAQLPPVASHVPQLVAQQMLPADQVAAGNSAIASGLTFQGNATVQGGCIVGGTFVGNINQAEGTQIHITITETGAVRGDVKAHQIVVMGRTQGLLDASAGLVTLHESANVQGHVRYAKLQVNGAELNATLEKSAPVSHGA